MSALVRSTASLGAESRDSFSFTVNVAWEPDPMAKNEFPVGFAVGVCWTAVAAAIAVGVTEAAAVADGNGELEAGGVGWVFEACVGAGCVTVGLD